MGLCNQRYTPAVLTLEIPGTRCRGRLDGLQGRSGRVRKISPPTGIRSPDRPTRSESLYRLSQAVNTQRTVTMIVLQDTYSGD